MPFLEQAPPLYIQSSNFLDIHFLFLLHSARAGSADSSRCTVKKKKTSGGGLTIAKAIVNSLHIQALSHAQRTRHKNCISTTRRRITQEIGYEGHIKLGRNGGDRQRQAMSKYMRYSEHQKGRQRKMNRNNNRWSKTKFLIYTACSTARYTTQCFVASAVGNGSQ